MKLKGDHVVLSPSDYELVFQMKRRHVPAAVIREYVARHPNASNAFVAIACGTDSGHVAQVRASRPLNEIRGSRCLNAKLDERRVMTMLTRHKAGASYTELQREFGVDRRTVAQIVKGRAWKHVNREAA